MKRFKIMFAIALFSGALLINVNFLLRPQFSLGNLSLDQLISKATANAEDNDPKQGPSFPFTITYSATVPWFPQGEPYYSCCITYEEDHVGCGRVHWACVEQNNGSHWVSTACQ